MILFVYFLVWISLGLDDRGMRFLSGYELGSDRGISPVFHLFRMRNIILFVSFLVWSFALNKR